MDGVPLALPALSQAQEYQDRAARVGFDWPEIEGVLDKVREEIEEIKNAETDFELASEIGDLFFALVNVARWKHVDAESALRGPNMKFKKRFAYVDQGAKRRDGIYRSYPWKRWMCFGMRQRSRDCSPYLMNCSARSMACLASASPTPVSSR